MDSNTADSHLPKSKQGRGGGDAAPADSGADASVRPAGRPARTRLEKIYVICLVQLFRQSCFNAPANTSYSFTLSCIISWSLQSKFLKSISWDSPFKEQPTSRILSATATRVLQCTFPVAASRKDFSAIHTSPQLTSQLIMLTITFTIGALPCCQCSE